MPAPASKAAGAVKSAAVRKTRSGAGGRSQTDIDLTLSAGLVCGVDEAGRGPLAGPVVAAAVILDPAHPIVGLDDSKVLSAKKREVLFEQIREHALAYCVAEASVEEIDTLNILQATMLAMRRAVEGLALTPDLAQIDGNRCPPLAIRAQAIIGGDALVPAISAASILAKVTRDRQLVEMHQAHPQYGFDVHAGYGTARHMQALEQHGPCVHHRRSFAPVRKAWERLEAAGGLPVRGDAVADAKSITDVVLDAAPEMTPEAASVLASSSTLKVALELTFESEPLTVVELAQSAKHVPQASESADKPVPDAEVKSNKSDDKSAQASLF